jgi:hypothetical protein
MPSAWNPEHTFRALAMVLAIAKQNRSELHMVSVEEIDYMPEFVEEVREQAGTAARRYHRVLQRARAMAEADKARVNNGDKSPCVARPHALDRGLFPGDDLAQIVKQVAAQVGKIVDFLLRGDGVALAQLHRFPFGRGERVQMSGKVPGGREEVTDLSLDRGIEQIQPADVGFVNREPRQGESAELVEIFLGANLHIFQLPDFLEALHAIDDGYDLADQSRSKAAPGAAASKQKHGFLPLHDLVMECTRGNGLSEAAYRQTTRDTIDAATAGCLTCTATRP